MGILANHFSWQGKINYPICIYSPIIYKPQWRQLSNIGRFRGSKGWIIIEEMQSLSGNLFKRMQLKASGSQIYALLILFFGFVMQEKEIHYKIIMVATTVQ